MKIRYRCEVCQGDKRYPTFGLLAEHIQIEHGVPLDQITIVNAGLEPRSAE